MTIAPVGPLGHQTGCKQVSVDAELTEATENYNTPPLLLTYVQSGIGVHLCEGFLDLRAERRILGITRISNHRVELGA